MLPQRVTWLLPALLLKFCWAARALIQLTAESRYNVKFIFGGLHWIVQARFSKPQ
jgi:hypothetical protein